MERYRNLDGSSGVSAYEISSDFIIIRFSGTVKTYKYSSRKAGQLHIDKMKVLAQNGRGLNAYINRYVKNLYD